MGENRRKENGDDRRINEAWGERRNDKWGEKRRMRMGGGGERRTETMEREGRKKEEGEKNIINTKGMELKRKRQWLKTVAGEEEKIRTE